MVEEISLDEYKKAYGAIVAEERKRRFWIHLVVFVFVNAILIVNNLIITPKSIWFFYPLIGWGIALSVHYLFSIHWVWHKLEETEAKAEYRARKTKKEGIKETET